MKSKKGKIELLRLMIKVRRVEERLMELFAQGGIPGFLHVSIGQEAVSAGVCSCLNPEDTIFTTHRGHGQAVAKGLDLNRFMAEIYGKQSGYCKGKSGSMHIASKEAGVAGSNGIVGAGLPIALGTAFASTYKKNDSVTVCFFGDGASNQGTFHESLNMASVLKLPVIFCCENNGWAQFTPQKYYMNIENISKRADSYGMPGVSVDGDDVVAVREAAQEAIRRARDGGGPTLLECKTHRWFGHYVGDQQKYRDQDDVKEVRKFDPIERLKNAMGKDADEALVDVIENEIREEIDAAVQFALSSPVAGPEEVMTDVYA